VRSGTLNIGNDTHPFEGQATINLLGDNTEEYFAFTPSIEAGNKNLVVTGNANFYGKPRDLRGRVLKTLYAGTNETYITAGLDWQPGETVVIAPSNMRTLDTDTAVILDYDPETGKISFEEDVEGYHFGDWESTADEYGVDMRSEIALVNRNI